MYMVCWAKHDLTKLTEVETAIGDIQPSNIFLNEKGDRLKVANQYSWPGFRNCYRKFIDGEQSFLPPEHV